MRIHTNRTPRLLHKLNRHIFVKMLKDAKSQAGQVSIHCFKVMALCKSQHCIIFPSPRLHRQTTTVNTSADRLVLDHIMLVSGQVMYAKAQQIHWKNDDFTQQFHTCMSYLGIPGKTVRRYRTASHSHRGRSCRPRIRQRSGRQC